MEPDLGGGFHRVALPVVAVRLRRGSHVGVKRAALVDTGAAFTVARMDIAAQFGMDPAAVRASSDQVSLAGASGGVGDAWGWEFELHLGAGGVSSRLVLPGARVYFAEWGLAGFDLVLGHHDVLERLTLTVANHPPTPGFVLRFPPRR